MSEFFLPQNNSGMTLTLLLLGAISQVVIKITRANMFLAAS
jgi:hypothetical protein